MKKIIDLIFGILAIGVVLWTSFVLINDSSDKRWILSMVLMGMYVMHNIEDCIRKERTK